MNKSYGFQHEYDPEDRLFGAKTLSGEVLQPDGNWTPYLVKEELQRKNNLETSSCVTFGILNGIEMLIKKKTGNEFNYSERYTSTLAETSLSGNNPKRVAQTVRKNGLIPESLLPFDETINTWDKFYAPIKKDLLWVGKKWLFHYEFEYEWVFQGRTDHELLREALKYSPVGVSVRAWKKSGQYYVKDAEEQDNHWCTCYGYDNGWLIYDHYDDTTKLLHPDYHFNFAMIYRIIRKPKLNWFQQLLKQCRIG